MVVCNLNRYSHDLLPLDTGWPLQKIKRLMPLSHYSVPSHSIRAFSKNGIAKRTFIAGV